MSILEGNVSGSISGTLQLNGEGGTDNYNELDNKPQINGVTLTGNKNSEDLNIIADVRVNGVSTVDTDMIADITIPPTPTIPVTDVKVNNQSAMVGTVAEITIPPTPTIPVTDVKVNNQSAMVGTVAEITIPPTPTIPVEDVRVNNASVVSGGIADINIPVLDVTVDGDSVVDANKVATITMPSVPVQDVEVGGSSVVNAQGVAEIPAPGYPVTDVLLNGVSALSGTIANIQPTAAGVSFDNTASGYTATQSQDAIDEVAALIADLNTNVGDFDTPLDTTAQNCHDAIDELKGTLTDFKYGNYSTLTLALNEEWTAPSMGVVSGFFRGNVNATCTIGIKSNKVNNGYRYLASVLSGGTALYIPIELFVVKGEKLTIATLIDVYVGGSNLFFLPFTT